MGSLKATSTRNDRGFLSRQNGDWGGGGGQHPVSQGPRGAVEKASTRQIFPQSCLPLVPGHISRSPRETKESVKVPGPLGWWLRALVLGFNNHRLSLGPQVSSPCALYPRRSLPSLASFPLTSGPRYWPLGFLASAASPSFSLGSYVFIYFIVLFLGSPLPRHHDPQDSFSTFTQWKFHLCSSHHLSGWKVVLVQGPHGGTDHSLLHVHRAGPHTALGTKSAPPSPWRFFGIPSPSAQTPP